MRMPSGFILLCCLAGWAVRLPLLARFPFREDEAIYAFWARHFLHIDPFFLTVWPDKPPIFLWLLAGAFGLAAPETPLQSEAVARWINVAASVLTIPLAASIARQWWDRRAQVVTAACLAFNPFAIAFAPTGYTDSTLVLLGTLALACAVHKRWFWAGLWLGCAIMTKQQGLFYVPLIAGLWLQTALPSQPSTQLSTQQTSAQKSPAITLGMLLLGVALVLVPIIYWDSLRWAVAPSPWDLAQHTYSPIGLAPVAHWRERARDWAALLWYLAASWTLWAAVAALWIAAWAAQWSTQGSTQRTAHALHRQTAPARLWNDARAAPLLLWLWSGGFLAAHILSTVQIWDRYLLPLAPVFALSAGWAMARIIPAHSRAQQAIAQPQNRVTPPKTLARATRMRLWQSPHRAFGALFLLLLLLLPPGWHAGQGRYPIGADHGDYAGLHQALDWLDAHAGPRYILYHQVLGWHYPFYLFHAIREGRVELRWFPGPPGLADNAAKMPFPPKYLVIPAWSPQPDLPLHLRTRGLILEPRLHSGRFTVMEIVRLPQTPCDWCLCNLPESFPKPPWSLARPNEAGMMSQP